MARLWRVHHPGLSASSGESFDLAPIEARHVQRVLRLRTGERIAVFDGTGSEWVAVLEASGPAGVTVRLEQPIDRVVEPSLEVALFQGLCKPDAKATVFTSRPSRRRACSNWFRATCRR